MLLTLLALAVVLLLLEETLSRVIGHVWRSTRWIVLPAAAVTVVNQVPVTLFQYPLVLDTVAAILLGLAAAFLVGMHGTFRDTYWPTRTARRAATMNRAHVPDRARPVRPVATATTGNAVRAPLRARP